MYYSAAALKNRYYALETFSRFFNYYIFYLFLNDKLLWIIFKNFLSHIKIFIGALINCFRRSNEVL